MISFTPNLPDIFGVHTFDDSGFFIVTLDRKETAIACLVSKWRVVVASGGENPMRLDSFSVTVVSETARNVVSTKDAFHRVDICAASGGEFLNLHNPTFPHSVNSVAIV